MKRNNKHVSVILALTMVLGTVLSGVSAYAENIDLGTASEEVIYATLEPGGGVKSAYAVVIIDAGQSKTVSHYGSFEEIKNLTDSSEVAYENGKLTADAVSERFYCQGNLESPKLPWNVSIGYEHDGRKVGADELSGASGKLKIQINTTKNDGVGEEFFENYMLQASVTLDTKLCKNITAEGATIANAGSSKMINFMVMPGTEGKMSLTAEVTDFYMSGISIAAVPYDVGDALGNVSELTSGLNGLTMGVSQLTEGIARLSTGASGLSSGAATLSNGAKSYGAGMAQLSANSENLVNASAQIYGALGQISGGLNGETGDIDIGALVQLPAGLKRLAAGLDEVSAGLTQLSDGYAAAYSAMSSAVAAIPAPAVSERDIAELMAANPDNKALAALAANYSAAQTVRGTWQQSAQAFEGVSKGLPSLSSSVGTVSSALKSMAANLDEAIKNSASLSGLAELVSGMAQLRENYGSFHEGLVTYASGVKALAGNWSSVEKGVNDLAAGAGALDGGAKETAKGANVLNQEVQSIPGRVNELVGEFDKGDFEPVSFLSDKNDNCRSVQFVISTESIEKPEREEIEPERTDSNTLWDRLKALFT